MHAIAGLPRSGSTLLCNILNQNPEVYASSTSELPAVIEAMISTWSGTQELRGRLGNNRSKTEQTVRRVLRSVCEAWYNDDRTVFDKSRGWTGKVRLLQHIYPKGKAFILVRDLREVFASFEKQDRKNPGFRMGPRLPLETRATNMFGPNGMIGAPLAAIKSCLDGRDPVFFIKYEDLVSSPDAILAEIYNEIGLTSFQHDYDSVKSVAEDPDHLWLHKYPHNGAGKVKLPPPQYRHFISESFGNAIVSKFQWFYNVFYPEVLASHVATT